MPYVWKSSVKVLVGVFFIGLVSLFSTYEAKAVVLHGATIAKGCVSPKLPGETADCDIQVGYNDAAGDTISIDEVWDVQDFGGDNVRIPAAGNLPITGVSGNTTCAVAGALPCKIGPAGSTLSGLPGTGSDGLVTFHSDTYVIQANDPDPLPDQGNAKVHDLCDDPDTSSCNSLSNTLPFTSQTDLKHVPDVVTEIHDPDHNVVSSVPVGTTVHDKATVSGSQGVPTGNIDFLRFANDECEGNPVIESSDVALDVAGEAESSGFATSSAGGLSYQAHYDGDRNYTEATGKCEPLTVEKLNSAVRTEVHDPDHNDITGNSMSVGIKVHDKAIVVGSGPTPTNTVDFKRYTTIDCKGNSVNENDVALVGGEAESIDFTTVAGFLSYLVHYDGDAIYKVSDGVCEPLTVEKLTPTVRTQIHDPIHDDVTNTTVVAGLVVHDKAFVGGSTATPSGTVDFKRFTNGSCSGDPASTQNNVALDSSANPAITESSDFATVAGSMSYQIHYDGDKNYKEADGICEPLKVEEPALGCTLTQGFWKNHADAWPVSSLKLGSVNYTKAQLLSILKTPVKGNGLISLAHQLIAAKLNIESGASSTGVATYIAQADSLINGKVVPPVGTGYLAPSTTSPLTSKLDNYNNGLIGPGHCND